VDLDVGRPVASAVTGMNTVKPTLVGLAIGAAIAASGVAHADPGPALDCAHSGAHVCAPGDSTGGPHVQPGCYDDAATPVLQFVWPCTQWTPDDGRLSADGTTVTYPPDHQADGDQNATAQKDPDGKPKPPHPKGDELGRLGADRALDHARLRPWRR
jgi:hypothetical protein